MQVDFYLIEKNDPNESALLTYRLLEKAYLNRHRVFVFCDDQTQAEEIDEQLWTFEDDSFIPHNLQGEGPEPPPPIQIGCEAASSAFHDVLLNLSNTVPPFYKQFKRILEIVDNNDKAKEISREHYRYYRSKRYKLHTHSS